MRVLIPFVIEKEKKYLEHRAYHDEVRRGVVESRDDILKMIVEFLHDSSEYRYFVQCGELPPDVYMCFVDCIVRQMCRIKRIDFDIYDKDSNDIVNNLDNFLMSIHLLDITHDRLELGRMIYMNLMVNMTDTLNNFFDAKMNE
jgi:hypothetical protein